MKILRVYPFLPPRRGGMEKHVSRLSHYQREQGHEVVVAFNYGEETAAADIKILPRLKLDRVRPQVLRDLIFYLSLCVSLIKNRYKFDVIHLHGDWSAFIFGRLLTKISTATVLCCSIHGKVHGGRIRQFVYSRILSQFDFLYCTGLSEYHFLKNNVMPETDLYWQPSGIDAVFVEKEYRPADYERYDVVTVGSLLPIKNHKLFIDVASKIPELKFAIAGEGPLRKELESYIHQLNLSNVELLGQIDTNEVSDLLANSKIFLLTSYSEGTSTAMMEAMAAGKVVITTESNDYSLLLGASERGLVSKAFDSSIIAQNILDVLADATRYAEISTNAKVFGRNFFWDNVARQITNWITLHEKR